MAISKFSGNLVHSPRFGLLRQEKSGNPGLFYIHPFPEILWKHEQKLFWILFLCPWVSHWQEKFVSIYLENFPPCRLFATVVQECMEETNKSQRIFGGKASEARGREELRHGNKCDDWHRQV
jgi:hypothetical protein